MFGKTLRILMVILLFLPGALPALSVFAEDNPALDELPPSILPIVMLSGSDYEMGRQYGEQASSFIMIRSQAQWAAASERFNRDEILQALKAIQHYVKEYTPEWIDFLNGMADGVSASGYDFNYSDALLLNCTLPDPETSHYPDGAEQDKLPPKRCSVASAWGSATRGGGLIGIDTLDSGDVPHAVVIVAYPDKGNAYICAADAGEIGDHFLMNNKGLFLGNSGGGGSPRPEDSDYGISWGCSLPYLVRFSDNAVQAKNRIMGWKINIPENFHFVDVHGGAWVVEKTPAVQCARKPGDFDERDFMFSTNNYLCSKMAVTKEGPFVTKHGGFGAYSAPRNQFIWDMLHNYHGNIDLEFAKMILRFPGNPPPSLPEGGWDAVFCRPTNLWTAVVQPDDGDKGVVNICTGPAGRVLHASVASDQSIMRPTYQYVDGMNTFFRLRLAASPKEMVEEARIAAREEIAAAYSKFMFLRYSDPGYGELNSLYGRANAEFFSGRNAFNRGRLSSGSRALREFARAATCFTRAQAHARRVYEALVPPPTSPSDLGLKPFGGDWAQWETRVGVKK